MSETTPDMTERELRMLSAVASRGRDGVAFSDPALDRLVELGLVEWDEAGGVVIHRVTSAGLAALPDAVMSKALSAAQCDALRHFSGEKLYYRTSSYQWYPPKQTVRVLIRRGFIEIGVEQTDTGSGMSYGIRYRVTDAGRAAMGGMPTSAHPRVAGGL